MKRIFILKRTEHVRCDEIEALIVRAADEATARTLAAAQARDKGPEVWTDARRSTCDEAERRGENAILFVSVLEG